MQTLEPAFEQLNRIQVLGSYQVLSSEDWRIALHRHPGYVSERKTLLMHRATRDPEIQRATYQEQFQEAGMAAKTAAAYCQAAITALDFYGLERCTRVLQGMQEQEVLPHVATSLVRSALDAGPSSPSGRDLLDWCEIAIHICRQKRSAGQTLRNVGGLLVKIVRDPETRDRLVSPELYRTLTNSYRRQQEGAERRNREDQERELILEYEQSRMQIAEMLFQDMPDVKKALLRKQKAEVLRQQERFQRIAPEIQEREIEAAIIQDIAKKEAPPYEKWRLRKQAQQAVLAFQEPEKSAMEGIA